MSRLPILLLALTACSPKTTDTSGNDTATTDTCPRDGTVPASARDVEREAEGIANTACGTHPEHVADWDRVAGIMSLLDEVWATTKTDCPDLTPDVGGAIDDAVAKLNVDIPAQDAEATPPDGYGPSDHACSFACTQDADCTSPLTCDIPSGKCTP